jgi:hypothetical protein
VKHSDFAAIWWFCLLARREQRKPSIPFANKSWHAVPHAFIKPLEPENFGVPFRRSLDIAHADGDMIDSFKFHDLSDLYFWRDFWIHQRCAAVGINQLSCNPARFLLQLIRLPPRGGMRAGWGTETFEDNFAEFFE